MLAVHVRWRGTGALCAPVCRTGEVPPRGFDPDRAPGHNPAHRPESRLWCWLARDVTLQPSQAESGRVTGSLARDWRAPGPAGVSGLVAELVLLLRARAQAARIE